ncbi:MAG: S-layer homology domain-containing protein [Clostridia bacterium]|nr:S-layer homology domain-containing protein [Clostridia bacterium]
MKYGKNIVSIVIALCMLMSLTTACAKDDSGFEDVAEDAAYAEAVKFCYENNLMSGTSETEFSPDENTSRAMLVTVLYRNEGEPEVEGESAFEDVEAGSWYESAVIWAAENGIVSGYDSTHFAPTDLLTREQILTIIWRLEGSPSSDEELLFADEDDISDYAMEAIAWAAENGIISNTSAELSPSGYITRAEMAQILYNYLTAPEAEETEITGESAATVIVTINDVDFTLILEDNDTTATLLAALGDESMNLPIYHFDDYENYELYQYYEIPSRYKIPTSPVAVTSEKAGEVYIDEENVVYLFYRDAEIEGKFTKIGALSSTEGLADAVEENPVVEGWGNKIITLKRGDDDD